MSSDVELDAAVDALSGLLPVDLSRLSAPHMLAQSALYYATELGWRVFPLAVNGKTPLTRRGFKDASNDAAVVRAWWTRSPQANIGTPTGEAFDVIDIDAPDGYATWETVRAERKAGGLELPPVIAHAHTGNGGRHLFIASQNYANGANWGRGLDYRGRGGYVVLPPSRLDTGGLYSWLKQPAARRS